jgi:hypothetical protein
MALAPAFRRVLAPLAAVVLLAACGGTETGNPPGPVRLSVVGTSSAPTTAVIGPSQGGLSIEEALVSFASVELLPCGSDPAPAAVRNWIVDLGHDPPTQTTIETTLREYCGVRIELAPAAEGPGVPSGIALRSAFLRGKRADSIAFEVASATYSTIDLLPVAPPPGRLAARSIILSFDVVVWLRGLGLDRVSRDPRGVVLVDAQTQPAALAMFDQQTAEAAILHVDVNQNGRLDMAEIAPTATATSTQVDAGVSGARDAEGQ